MSDAAHTVDYDTLKTAYEASLTTMLRGFRGGAAFLENWVHDPDDVKSILNIVEAAATGGLPEVCVVLGAQTAAGLDRARLEDLARALGEATLAPTDGGRSAFTVRFAARSEAAGAGGAAAYERAQRARQARDERLRAASAAARPAAHGPIHAVYRDAVARIVAAPLTHEGEPPSGARGERVAVTREGATLTAVVDPATHVVLAARHAGGGDEARRALLEALCDVMEGKPLLECADHAVTRVEHRLRDRTKPRPVAGIVTPAAVEPAFAVLAALVREVLADYRRRTGYAEADNRFDPEPAAAWRALSHGQRLEALQRAVDATAARHGLAAGEVTVTRLDKTTRVTVALPDDMAPARKASLLMGVEHDLKAALDSTLHVYQEEMKDKNKLRRL